MVGLRSNASQFRRCAAQKPDRFRRRRFRSTARARESRTARAATAGRCGERLRRTAAANRRILPCESVLMIASKRSPFRRSMCANNKSIAVAVNKQRGGLDAPHLTARKSSSTIAREHHNATGTEICNRLASQRIMAGDVFRNEAGRQVVCNPSWIIRPPRSSPAPRFPRTPLRGEDMPA